MKITVKQKILYVQIFCTVVIIFIAFFVPIATAGGYKLYSWGSVAPTNCAMADACGGKTNPLGLVFPILQVGLNWLIYRNISAIYNSESSNLQAVVVALFLINLLLFLITGLPLILDADDPNNTTILGGFIYALLSFIMLATNFIVYSARKSLNTRFFVMRSDQ